MSEIRWFSTLSLWLISLGWLSQDLPSCRKRQDFTSYGWEHAYDGILLSLPSPSYLQLQIHPPRPPQIKRKVLHCPSCRPPSLPQNAAAEKVTLTMKSRQNKTTWKSYLDTKTWALSNLQFQCSLQKSFLLNVQLSVGVKNMDPGTRLPRFDSWLHHLILHRLGRVLTQCLSFTVFKEQHIHMQSD